jgi:hypothetical protein
MRSFLWSVSDVRITRAAVSSKKGGGARNQKDNIMEQDCFIETHLESVH